MRALFSVALFTLAACISDAPDNSCDSYCSAMAKACAGSDAQYVFATGTMDPTASCKAICAQFPKTGDVTGNTQKCRAAQLSTVDEAKGNAMMVHQRCMDSGPFSEICGGGVANYCRLNLAICSAFPAFGSQQDCETALTPIANGFDKGVNDDGVPSLNTKVCRFYHIEKATDVAATHCPHTKSPSPVCTM